MNTKPLVLAALGLALVALPADADTTCNPKGYEWELELTRVECELGDADLQAVATSLGTKAILHGGFRDPAHPKQPPRVYLIGSTDGAGLNVGMEPREDP